MSSWHMPAGHMICGHQSAQGQFGLTTLFLDLEPAVVKDLLDVRRRNRTSTRTCWNRWRGCAVTQDALRVLRPEIDPANGRQTTGLGRDLEPSPAAVIARAERLARENGEVTREFVQPPPAVRRSRVRSWCAREPPR